MKNEIVIENTKDENVLIVDENDNVIGSNTRKEMRINNLIHRTTSILVIDKGNNKILVQKRSEFKEYCPGYLDLMVGGIVGSDEGNNEKEAAIREVYEEIGLDLKNEEILSNSTFNFIGKTFYRDQFISLWAYFFILEINSNISPQIKYIDGEVESTEWLSKSEIIGKIKKDKNITPDSVHCFNFYLDNLK